MKSEQIQRNFEWEHQSKSIRAMYAIFNTIMCLTFARNTWAYYRSEEYLLACSCSLVVVISIYNFSDFFNKKYYHLTVTGESIEYWLSAKGKQVVEQTKVSLLEHLGVVEKLNSKTVLFKTEIEEITIPKDRERILIKMKCGKLRIIDVSSLKDKERREELLKSMKIIFANKG